METVPGKAQRAAGIAPARARHRAGRDALAMIDGAEARPAEPGPPRWSVRDPRGRSSVRSARGRSSCAAAPGSGGPSERRFRVGRLPTRGARARSAGHPCPVRDGADDGIGTSPGYRIDDPRPRRSRTTEWEADDPPALRRGQAPVRPSRGKPRDGPPPAGGPVRITVFRSAAHSARHPTSLRAGPPRERGRALAPMASREGRRQRASRIAGRLPGAAMMEREATGRPRREAASPEGDLPPSEGQGKR